MKLPTLLLFFLFALRGFAAPQPVSTTASLATAHYDLAELVFRQYMSADTKYVYHLHYGTNDAVMPADFMARFKGQAPLVRSVPNGTRQGRNKVLLDKITRKEAIGLRIQELRVTDDAAEVQVIFFATATSNSRRYYLVREHNKWRVKEMKREWIACGG